VNPDLPQFEHDLEGWSQINMAYDLAAYAFMIPVAIQIFGNDFRVLATGIITSTEDEFAPESRDNEWPINSVFYMRDAEPIRIDWNKTQAVLAMVAIAPDEPGELPGDKERDDDDDHRGDGT
jgi:hypothetical protein